MIFGSSLHYRRSRYHAFKFDGERSSALDLAHGRLVLMSAFFVLFYTVLAIRAFDLSVIQALPQDADTGAAQEWPQAQAEVSGEGLPHGRVMRADITDRNGVLLATTLKTASLYADAQLISDAKSTAEGLITIFPELSYGAVFQKLQSGKRFIWIKRNITPDEEYAVLELGQPGLQFRREERRFYPQGALAAHLVGYTDVDARGLAGVERSFDNYLNEGRSLSLTIDIRLQHALRREIRRAVEEFSASSASGVIMDVKTGEILAGVSLPDFDPHDPGRASKEALFSHLTQGAYELGSVFKIFSTAALFESRNVPMSTTFDAREPLKRGRYTIRDYHAKERILTLPEVFMYSSNIGSAMMGEAVGTEALKAFYEDLGLLTPLELEIRETAHPIVPSPWRDINALTASYGHGVATTPVQLVSAVSSIVNGGLLVKPSVVLHDTLQKSAEAPHIRVVSERTAEKMRELLRLVVTDGTGSNADVKGYQVGGKTGTAEKLVNGRYDRTKRMSSFVGVFPMDAPRYAVFVLVDEPQGNARSFGYATGGWVAAPAVARTIVSMASILGLPPEAPSRADPASPLKQYISTAGDR